MPANRERRLVERCIGCAPVYVVDGARRIPEGEEARALIREMEARRGREPSSGG